MKRMLRVFMVDSHYIEASAKTYIDNVFEGSIPIFIRPYSDKNPSVKKLSQFEINVFSKIRNWRELKVWTTALLDSMKKHLDAMPQSRAKSALKRLNYNTLWVIEMSDEQHGLNDIIVLPPSDTFVITSRKNLFETLELGVFTAEEEITLKEHLQDVAYAHCCGFAEESKTLLNKLPVDVSLLISKMFDRQYNEQISGIGTKLRTNLLQYYTHIVISNAFVAKHVEIVVKEYYKTGQARLMNELVKDAVREPDILVPIIYHLVNQGVKASMSSAPPSSGVPDLKTLVSQCVERPNYDNILALCEFIRNYKKGMRNILLLVVKLIPNMIKEK